MSPYQPIENYQGAFGFQGPTQAQYQNSFPQQQQQQQPSPMGTGGMQGNQDPRAMLRTMMQPGEFGGQSMLWDMGDGATMRNPFGNQMQQQQGGQQMGFRGINGSM